MGKLFPNLKLYTKTPCNSNHPGPDNVLTTSSSSSCPVHFASRGSSVRAIHYLQVIMTTFPRSLPTGGPTPLGFSSCSNAAEEKLCDTLAHLPFWAMSHMFLPPHGFFREAQGPSRRPETKALISGQKFGQLLLRKTSSSVAVITGHAMFGQVSAGILQCAVCEYQAVVARKNPHFLSRMKFAVPARRSCELWSIDQ